MKAERIDTPQFTANDESGTANRRPRHVLAHVFGLAVIVIAVAFLFLYSRMHSTKVSPAEAVALISPSIKMQPVDPAARQRYAQLVNALAAVPVDIKLQSNFVTIGSYGLDYPRAELKASKAGLDRVVSLEQSGPIQSGDIGSDQTALYILRGNDAFGGISGALNARAELAAGDGDRAGVVRFLGIVMSAYPKFEESTGPNMCPIADKFAQTALANAEGIAGHKDFNANELQQILDAMPTAPTHSVAAHDAIAYAERYMFIPMVLDPAKRFDLLAMSPIPLDAPINERATIEEANRLFLITEKNLDRPWSQQDKSLGPTFFNLNTGLRPILSGPTFAALEGMDAIKARWNLYMHPNALGEYLITSSAANFGFPAFSFFERRTLYEGARLTLALGIYRDTFHKWPTSLDDLVTAKILKSVPTDPFSGKPFRYDRKRAIFWSVGSDGVDNGGVEITSPTSSTTAHDIVFPAFPA